MIKQNKGFTLIELIITIVVSSIALLLIAYLLTNIYSSWNKIKAKNERDESQKIVEHAMEKVKEFINNGNYNCYIDSSDLTIDNDNDPSRFVLSFTYDSSTELYTIHHSSGEYELLRVQKIEFIKVSDHTFILRLLFDDDSSIEKRYSFKLDFNWE